MNRIHLETVIRSDIETVFDLARSIEAHMRSTGNTREHVVRGKPNGLFELGDEITWRGRHFGIWQELSVRVTEMEIPTRFVDVMTSGAFESMRHEHLFRSDPEGTCMIDDFEFRAPFGPLGRLAEHLFLARHMRSFLVQRNRVLKELAEGPSPYDVTTA